MLDKITPTKTEKSEENSRTSNIKNRIRYFLSNNNEFILEKDTTDSNIINDKYWHNEKEVTLDKDVNGDTKQEFKNQIKMALRAYLWKHEDPDLNS